MEHGARSRALTPGLALMGLIGALFVVLGVPVIMLEAQGDDVASGPAWLWPTVYAGFVATYLVTSLLTDSTRRDVLAVSFAAQALLAVATVLLIHTGMGYIKIVLVFSAAMSAYVLPRWGSALVILGNSAVVVLSTPGVAEKAINAVFYTFVQAVTAFTVMTWLAQERSRRELAEAHVELAATSALLDQSARAEERLRISRDLHDVAGHGLTALALELEIASHKTEGPAADHIARARAIAKDLLADVRDSVSELREDRGSLGDALSSAVAGIGRPKVELSVEDGLTTDADRRTAFVRAAQEIVTNTIRHAGEATRLRIEVVRGTGEIILSADDDGWARRDFVLGNGLRGLRERAEHFGGSAEFSRNADGGFQVRLVVPE